MKELSIEEKAKAYNEVRKKIAIRFGSNVADEIFSQFEESEDERIRQFLIHEIEETSDEIMSYRGMNKESVIAWFEKQGDKDEEILILKDQIESLHAAIKAIKETHKIELEKQGEQKPAWSEEDEYNQAWIVEMLYGLEDEDKEYEKKCRDMAEWLKSLNNKCFPLKPKMWSEEDNQYLYGFIGLIEQSKAELPITLKGKAADNCINWLKSLKDRVQPKQEWSEEDELKIFSILYLLHQIPNYHFDNWLKSLRPQKQWKPSEEQIMVLEAMLTVSPQSPAIQSALIELYKQLKKLREE